MVKLLPVDGGVLPLLAGVTHDKYQQHGPCWQGSCCACALTVVSEPNRALDRVLLHPDPLQQRAPQAGLQLTVRVGRVRGGLR